MQNPNLRSESAKFFTQSSNIGKNKCSKKLTKTIFTIFGPDFGIVEVSSGQYIEFFMRNPIFRSEISYSIVYRSKVRKNYLRLVVFLRPFKGL